jgi:hypothetical protein
VLDLGHHGDCEAILSIPVSEDVADVTVVGVFVVFANHPDGRLNVVASEAHRILDVVVAGPPTGLTWDGGRLWYCDYLAGRLGGVEEDLARASMHA